MQVCAVGVGARMHKHESSCIGGSAAQIVLANHVAAPEAFHDLQQRAVGHLRLLRERSGGNAYPHSSGDELTVLTSGLDERDHHAPLRLAADPLI